MLRPYLFFFNDTATTEIYTLSLHDALPICLHPARHLGGAAGARRARRGQRHHRVHPATDARGRRTAQRDVSPRSEEHTSELQSQFHLVCRLLLEKKNYVNRLQSVSGVKREA